ncbi:cell division FtsZ-interacting protein ZapD [Paraburkholderia youngii]
MQTPTAITPGGCHCYDLPNIFRTGGVAYLA